MQYHSFGQTGIQISALGFGAMRLPTTTINGQTVYDTEAGIRIIRRAFDLGVNYVDTAPYYCGGDSEIIVGQALKGWRDKVYLSTKNTILISSSLPPIAFMMPISRVLSSMDMTMVFMIPSAATIKAIVPMAPSMEFMIRNALFISLS